MKRVPGDIRKHDLGQNYNLTVARCDGTQPPGNAGLKRSWGGLDGVKEVPGISPEARCRAI
jgi:hypothetical protein